MKTECETEKMQFQASGPRKVEGHFDGDYLSSNGGKALDLLIPIVEVYELSNKPKANGT